MTPRRWLWAYLAALLAASAVQDIRLLALALLVALLASGSHRWHLLRRSVLAIAAFNLSVSLGVLAVGWWQGAVDTDWLLLANLRVLLMVFLGFWFVARVPLLAALAGWPAASLVATLALGQARSLDRLLRDYRMAFESRNIARPRWRDRRHQAGAQAVALLDKAQAQSAEVALAMRSRGAFDA
jgi:cobalt/nickel transport system permease protein